MTNVVIKKSVHAFNIDALNRTAKCSETIDNGCVFELKTQSTTEGETNVWNATPPTATSKDLWMATSPETVIVRDLAGNEYKGERVTKDPRAFTNLSGYVFDAIKPTKEDLIVMTGAGITGIETASNKYLVPSTGYTLVASATAGTGFALRKISNERVLIANPQINKEPIKGYKFVVENN